jgi:hypothetical protein
MSPRLGFTPRLTDWLTDRQSQCDFDWRTRVEAGSNTSTVTLRVIWGDEKGSLKSETVKYGRQYQGTRTRERLWWQGTVAYSKDRPILSSERAPHKKQDCNCQNSNKYLVMSPKTYWLTDHQSQCDSDFDLNQGSDRVQLRAVARNSSGESMRTEQIGTRSTEEYRRSACEDLTCDLKTLFMCNIWSVDSARLL